MVRFLHKYRTRNLLQRLRIRVVERKQGSNDTNEANQANQTNAANEVQDEVNFGPYFGSNVAVCQLRTSMEVP